MASSCIDTGNWVICASESANDCAFLVWAVASPLRFLGRPTTSCTGLYSNTSEVTSGQRASVPIVISGSTTSSREIATPVRASP